MTIRSPDIERAVLGACLIYGSSVITLALTLGDLTLFSDPFLRRVFEALKRSLEAGETPNETLILDRMTAESPISDAQRATVHTMALELTGSGMDYVASLVRRLEFYAAKRKAITLVGEINRELHDADTIAELEAAMHRARVCQLAGGDAEHVGSIIADYWPLSSDDLGPFALPRLGRSTRAMLPGTVTTWAARPRTGKTILGIQTALTAAAADLTSLVVSAEMTKTQVGERMLGAVLKTEPSKLYLLHEEELRAGQIELSKKPIKISKSRRISQVRAEVERERFDVVVIDYIGLMLPDTRHTKRHEEVGEVMQEIKEMTSSTECRTVALQQMSRQYESENFGRRKKIPPELYHIKDSSTVEESSDYVFMMVMGEDPKWRTVHHKKNRHGEEAEPCSVRLETNGLYFVEA